MVIQLVLLTCTAFGLTGCQPCPGLMVSSGCACCPGALQILHTLMLHHAMAMHMRLCVGEVQILMKLCTI